MLRRWVNQEREGVLDMRPNRPIRSEAATEVERLQRELRRVTMERDILKKALVLLCQGPGSSPRGPLGRVRLHRAVLQPGAQALQARLPQPDPV